LMQPVRSSFHPSLPSLPSLAQPVHAEHAQPAARRCRAWPARSACADARRLRRSPPHRQRRSSRAYPAHGTGRRVSGDQSHLESKRAQPACPVLRAAEFLHRDDAARGQRRAPRLEAITRSRLGGCRLACAIYRVDLDHALGRISGLSSPPWWPMPHGLARGTSRHGMAVASPSAYAPRRAAPRRPAPPFPPARELLI
jgi:hypothetical protein